MMSSIPVLEREYHIVYYPPKSEQAGNQTFYITVISMCFSIGVLPMVLIFAFGVQAVVAFIVAAICAITYLWGIQPLLVRRAGERSDIYINAREIRMQFRDKPDLKLHMNECAFSWYEYSGSDEADLAGIKIKPKEGLQIVIERQYALEGDFEELLREFRRQKIPN